MDHSKCVHFPPPLVPQFLVFLWNFQFFTSIFNALCLALSSSHHVLLYWCFMFLFVLSYLSPSSSPFPCVFLLSLSPSASSQAQFCPYFVCYLLLSFLLSLSLHVFANLCVASLTSDNFSCLSCSWLPHPPEMPSSPQCPSPSWASTHHKEAKSSRVQQRLRWQPGKQGQLWWESGAQWV